MSKGDIETTPESDVYEGAPHPRLATRLIGHAGAEAEMLGAYREGRLSPAWLICGREGIGKATLAWRFARFVLANPDPAARVVREARDLSTPSGNPAARQLAALAHPDFALLRRTWNTESGSGKFRTEISVKDVRDGLKKFHFCAAFGGWRVAILDSADDLNRAGANALLKMIEEPPSRSLILIVSHRPGLLLATIRSRCRRLRLDPLGPQEITEIVKSLGAPWNESSDAKMAAAAARADGSLRETLRRLDPEGQGLGALIENTLATLPKGDPRAISQLAEAAGGRNAGEAFATLNLALYDWLAARIREPSSPMRLEAIAGLWDRIRKATRETEELNLDRRFHVLALFQEISERARAL
jgi:DNA polymerase III subunit delta'